MHFINNFRYVPQCFKSLKMHCTVKYRGIILGGHHICRTGAVAIAYHVVRAWRDVATASS
jgi:hypothetical protein